MDETQLNDVEMLNSDEELLEERAEKYQSLRKTGKILLIIGAVFLAVFTLLLLDMLFGSGGGSLHYSDGCGSDVECLERTVNGMLAVVGYGLYVIAIVLPLGATGVILTIIGLIMKLVSKKYKVDYED